MFFGCYEHSLDGKNRVVLPLGLRRPLSDDQIRRGFVLATGPRKRYLMLFPLDEWPRYEKELRESFDMNEEEAEDYLIQIYASGNFVEVDKQYRFAIPEASRKAVGIQRDVCFVGMGDRVLVWAKERYDEWRESQRDRMVPPGQKKRSPSETPAASPPSG